MPFYVVPKHTSIQRDNQVCGLKKVHMLLRPKGSHCVVPFLFLFTTRLLAKSVSQFPVCTVFFKVNVVLGGNTDKQMEQCKYQDTKTFTPSFFTATRALASSDFQQFINEFGFPGQVQISSAPNNVKTCDVSRLRQVLTSWFISKRIKQDSRLC